MDCARPERRPRSLTLPAVCIQPSGETAVDELLADDEVRAAWRGVWQQRMDVIGAAWAAWAAERSTPAAE